MRSSTAVTIAGIWLLAAGAALAAPSSTSAESGSGSGEVTSHADRAADVATSPPHRVLRVCADPNNLPFSNAAGEGYENRIAQLIARDLDARLEYTWWAQRRGYVRSTLDKGECDLVPGTAAGVEPMATTQPYYRSTYVFLSRAADGLSALLSFDDERLRHLRIGVQLIGNDATNTPPAHALARRGIVENVRGYLLYGDYTRPNPPAAIVDAVANGDVDVALVWGPLAGYFARRAAVPLRLTPVPSTPDGGQWPMVFEVAMGVRRRDIALHDRIDAVLVRERPAIRTILEQYGVPQVDPPE